MRLDWRIHCAMYGKFVEPEVGRTIDAANHEPELDSDEDSA
jgi:hypothetical protein